MFLVIVSNLGRCFLQIGLLSGLLDTFENTLGQFFWLFDLLQDGVFILPPLILQEFVLLSDDSFHIEEFFLKWLWGFVSSLFLEVIQKGLVLHLIVFVELLRSLQTSHRLLILLIHLIYIFLIVVSFILFNFFQIFHHSVYKSLVNPRILWLFFLLLQVSSHNGYKPWEQIWKNLTYFIVLMVLLQILLSFGLLYDFVFSFLLFWADLVFYNLLLYNLFRNLSKIV